MSKLSRRAFLSLAGTAALAPRAWLSAEEPHVVNQPYNNLTEEEEIELGRKFGAELEKKIEILHEPDIQSYANRIVKKLGAASQRPHWPYQAKVVNTAQVNAFAVPGGFLYVNRGLLEFVEDENELAGVLAHEVGHVVARHTTNALVLNFMARHLFEEVKQNLFLNNDVIAQLIETLGGPVYLLAQLQYSRENESEADMLGFYEMLRAGWNPVGLSRFFTRLEQRTGPSNPLSVMLSDHPPSSERAAAVRRELQEVHVTAPAVIEPAAFHAMKQRLEQLPPAPKARRE
jgi:predicted Zn-dependent protease